MPNDLNRAELDPAAISLPTDRVTLGDIRRCQPKLFTPESLLERARFDRAEILATLHIELTLAEQSFARALGRADPYPEDSRQELLQMLNRDYRRYGLSTGLQQTRELVREFEAVAARQANAHLGR